MSRITLVAALLLAALSAVAASGIGFSGATFTSASTSRGNAISSGDWTGPTVSVTDPGSPLSGSITVSATAADAVEGVAWVAVEISAAGSGRWSELCRDTTAPYACALDTRLHADGRYDLRAIGADRAGNVTTSAIVAGRLIDNDPPAVTLANPGSAVRGTVTLTAGAGDGSGSGVSSVRIQRAPAGGTQWTDVCTVSAQPFDCAWDTTRLQNDVYDLRALATDGMGRTTASALVEVEVDNLAPAVTMSDPGSPLTGVVALAASATDADSGVARVRLQLSRAGTGQWADACALTTSPYSCRLDTTAGATPDGLYDFRAVATDVAGNERISAAVTGRRVDNSVSSVSLEDPGMWLTRTVTLAASGASTNGVRNVAVQFVPAGTTTWTTICTDATAPYSCVWDTATPATPDGLYDLRAVMTDSAGKVQLSAVLAGRRVDNSPVRGFDVQSLNGAGGTLGRLQTGDALVLTWNKEMAPATLVPGWTGAGSAAIHVRLRDAAAAGAAADSLDFAVNAAMTQATGLGSVALGGDYARSGRTAVHAATAALETVTVEGRTATAVRVTIGALVSGNGSRTSTVDTTMTWTPSAKATDLGGTPSSSAPVAELGASDRDF
jgi:hypothetical protein